MTLCSREHGDLSDDVASLLKDPRVDLRARQVEWAYAISLSEETNGGRDDPYETDQPGSGLVRSLSRVGGAPTRPPGRYVPTEPFLLQVDLRQQFSGPVPAVKARAFVRRSGLPRGGLLQLFHTTTGDSFTDPGIPGGGATVLHLTEDQLRTRRGPALGHECAGGDEPVRRDQAAPRPPSERRALRPPARAA